MAYGSFEDLEVWKRGCRLAVRVYEVLRNCKDYGLKDQMTRAGEVEKGSHLVFGTPVKYAPVRSSGPTG